MRVWAGPVGIGLVLAVAALAAVLASVSATPASPTERAETLARELRCPDCQGLSVADSPTRSAQEMRRQIDELVEAGASDAEVREHFTARYGEWIRLAPSAPALWVIPFIVVIGGVGLLAARLRGSRTGQLPKTESPLDVEQRRRLRDEVEALDA